jgi:hypothetical protein
MDFFNVIGSFERLLYEVVTRLVFYHRMMLRIVAHPATTTRYAEDEQKNLADEQHTHTLSYHLC